MPILSDTSSNKHVLNHVIEIIRHVIVEDEKKATNEVKALSVILKAELLERVAIKNKKSQNAREALFSINSNTSFRASRGRSPKD
jgi:hypothetical protein